MAERLFRTASAGILYDDSQAGKPDELRFTREEWRRVGSVDMLPGGRGSVLFVTRGERRWVIRHYLRGGFLARWLHDRYCWRGADRTRSFREWRVLREMRAAGLPVPMPVAARYVRTGLTYRADLITLEIPGVRTLAVAVSEGGLPEARWRQVGAAISALHQYGVEHADLNAHNILLAADGTVHVIDFDRARRRPAGPWTKQVLGRLHRSLCKVQRQVPQARFAAGDWAALLEGAGEGQDGR